MLKHVILLLFLHGIKYGSSNPREETVESKELSNGIKKNGFGANGLDLKSEEVLKNFRNPILEYILHKSPDRTGGSPVKKGIIREISHSQTLLMPNFSGGIRPLPEAFVSQLLGLNVEPEGSANRNPVSSATNTVNKTHDKVVISPVLHLNKNPSEETEDLTRIQVYPAMAILVTTFNKDGTLKNSVTHFQPDFNLMKSGTTGKEAHYVDSGVSAGENSKTVHNTQYAVNNFLGDPVKSFFGRWQSQNPYRPQLRQGGGGGGGGMQWPFAQYFPIVIKDPFPTTFNALSSGVYNAVSSMVEYGPEADTCRKEKESETPDEEDSARNKKKEMNVKTTSGGLNRGPLRNRFQIGDEIDTSEPKIYGEITTGTRNAPKSHGFMERLQNNGFKARVADAARFSRKRRDTTSVYIKTRQGDKVDITLEEPKSADGKKPGGNTLILRKGGVAIAGPGGAATAYTGGTAIVGPYGTVYKSPEGVAILGPFSKIVNITDDTSFEEILRMHREMQSQNQPAIIRRDQPEKLGFKNYRNFFSYLTDLPLKIDVKPKARTILKNGPNVKRLKQDDIVKVIEEIRQGEFRRIVQDAPHDEKMVKENETSLIFRPKSKAEAGRNGIALSAPTSHAVLYPGQKANIYFEPESVASAGPSGFAHAHSDLYVSYVSESLAESPEKNTTLNVKGKDCGALKDSHDGRARSFGSALVNPPPLSTILKPPHQGYADNKRKAKPSNPIKEEGSSEEVGEEHEEENSSQMQEGSNEGVAVSPPPDGASIAEAKPIGLAIAGPGGVAASKPQGTAVAGPGGLAIARPVGTAIAGVDVEGSVPIGGQQKHKKKPKQEQEQTETELHYVGGLTGPIGNPQPKEFADGLYYKSVRDSVGNNIRENLFFRGRQNSNGFHAKLGQQDGKYGFVPMLASPTQGTERLQKRVDPPTYFHGLLGSTDQGLDQFQNYQIQY